MLRGLLMMILIGGVVGYGNLILKSLEMIRDHSYKYGVDDSHNHKHSSEVLHFVSEINMNCYDRKRMNILILSALYHDVIDGKYMKFDKTKKMNILYDYVEKLDLGRDRIDIFENVWFIINNMSYSKTVIVDENNEPRYNEFEFIKKYENRDIYDLVRNADLISSYNLKRAFDYSIYKDNIDVNEITYEKINDIYKEVEDLYKRRMHKLRKNKILTLKNAKCDKLSRELDIRAFLKLTTYVANDKYSNIQEHFDMYPKINIENVIKHFKEKTI